MKKYILEIGEGNYGWRATVVEELDESLVILDSDDYGSFSGQERRKIVDQFRQELDIKRFYQVIQ